MEWQRKEKSFPAIDPIARNIVWSSFSLVLWKQTMGWDSMAAPHVLGRHTLELRPLEVACGLDKLICFNLVSIRASIILSRVFGSKVFSSSATRPFWCCFTRWPRCWMVCICVVSATSISITTTYRASPGTSEWQASPSSFGWCDAVALLLELGVHLLEQCTAVEVQLRALWFRGRCTVAEAKDISSSDCTSKTILYFRVRRRNKHSKSKSCGCIAEWTGLKLSARNKERVVII